MTGVAYENQIGVPDVKWWDGVSASFTRRTSTGGTLTLQKIGAVVNVANAYNDGVPAEGALTLAKSHIGATNKANLLLKPGTWSLTNSLTLTSNLGLICPPGVTVSLAAGVTLTINGPFQAGLYSVFTGDGTVVFGTGSVEFMRPEWFGVIHNTINDAAFTKALSVASASGCSIKFNPGTEYLFTPNSATPFSISNVPLVEAYGATFSDGFFNIYSNVKWYGGYFREVAFNVAGTRALIYVGDISTTANDVQIKDVKCQYCYVVCGIDVINANRPKISNITAYTTIRPGAGEAGGFYVHGSIDGRYSGISLTHDFTDSLPGDDGIALHPWYGAICNNTFTGLSVNGFSSGIKLTGYGTYDALPLLENNTFDNIAFYNVTNDIYVAHHILGESGAGPPEGNIALFRHNSFSNITSEDLNGVTHQVGIKLYPRSSGTIDGLHISNYHFKGLFSGSRSHVTITSATDEDSTIRNFSITDSSFDCLNVGAGGSVATFGVQILSVTGTHTYSNFQFKGITYRGLTDSAYSFAAPVTNLAFDDHTFETIVSANPNHYVFNLGTSSASIGKVRFSTTQTAGIRMISGTGTIIPTTTLTAYLGTTAAGTAITVPFAAALANQQIWPIKVRVVDNTGIVQDNTDYITLTLKKVSGGASNDIQSVTSRADTGINIAANTLTAWAAGHLATANAELAAGDTLQVFLTKVGAGKATDSMAVFVDIIGEA